MIDSQLLYKLAFGFLSFVFTLLVIAYVRADQLIRETSRRKPKQSVASIAATTTTTSPTPSYAAYQQIEGESNKVETTKPVEETVPEVAAPPPPIAPPALSYQAPSAPEPEPEPAPTPIRPDAVPASVCAPSIRKEATPVAEEEDADLSEPAVEVWEVPLQHEEVAGTTLVKATPRKRPAVTVLR